MTGNNLLRSFQHCRGERTARRLVILSRIPSNVHIKKSSPHFLIAKQFVSCPKHVSSYLTGCQPPVDSHSQRPESTDSTEAALVVARMGGSILPSPYIDRSVGQNCRWRTVRSGVPKASECCVHPPFRTERTRKNGAPGVIEIYRHLLAKSRLTKACRNKKAAG